MFLAVAVLTRWFGLLQLLVQLLVVLSWLLVLLPPALSALYDDHHGVLCLRGLVALEAWAFAGAAADCDAEYQNQQQKCPT